MNHTTENNQNWNSLDLEMSKCHTFQRKNIFDGGKVQYLGVINYGSIWIQQSKVLANFQIYTVQCILAMLV